MIDTGIRADHLRSARVGVVMSSGFFGFFAHAGFINALLGAGITPIGYAGTSAGALAAGAMAAGTAPESFKSNLFGLSKSDFWDPDYSHLVRSMPLFLKGFRGLLKGNKFRALLERDLPVKTFKECKYPCCIVSADITAKTRYVITSGSLIEAIVASSAVPGLFQPVIINGHIHVDGGLVDKVPVRALYELIKPDIIITHYLPTRSLEYPENYFLKRVFTPGKITSLTSAIAREEEYRLQCEYVRSRGCRVMEISPMVTKVNPGSLEKGPVAYQEAYDNTVAQLELT